jgi:hypothetical protein
MTYALDLTKNHFTQQHGDITVIGTWYGDTIDEREPCLAILPAYRRTKPVCIALSSAYKYNDPAYLLRATMEMVKRLELSDNMTTVHRLAGIINDHLLDLIKMPHKPIETDYGSGAEFTVKTADGKEVTAEMYEER